MLTINSDIVTVNKPIGEVMNFIGVLNNTGKLMPDQIINWAGDNDTCSYTIKGMADITMKVKERADKNILLESTSDKPFSFTLNYILSEVPEGCTFQIVFEGDVNPFLKMMVEKPMNNLFNFMVKQLPKKLE